MIQRDRIVEKIAGLPGNWHGAGCLSGAVIKAIADYASQGNFGVSVETGVGKSTLLLSHYSDRHIAFAADFGGSLTKTKESELLAAGIVEFVEGFCQDTVPAYDFPELDFVLIDGAHGYPFPELDYYYLYPHLKPGSIMTIDDIHIPTINNFFNFLKVDAMFRLDRVVGTTAFFIRTDAPTFDPKSDGWYLQNDNKNRFPVEIIDETGHVVPYTKPDYPKPW